MNTYGDITAIEELNSNLESSNRIADNSRVHNPAGEVRDALAEFITTRLRRVEDDAAFADVVRAAIRQRMPEATMDELIRLLNQTVNANNQTAATMATLFKNETSDKTPLERLDGQRVDTAAAQLYASTDDRNILQAVTYLGSVLSQISNNNVKGEAEVVE